MGGQLASIHSETDHRLVYDQLQDTTDVWIGLKKLKNGELYILNKQENLESSRISSEL
jgi:hypothetical protein